ncbi:hypothetical protein [uncultured Aliiroseovarius sp.]|uniref:hypothetical protein n=1 Tax=uncultured Aliiroseovarius sp. TaxID=1658783 RepID=UPI002621D8B1|nr:hypothetical protein [uncultured Aliiroseovarius sp.]
MSVRSIVKDMKMSLGELDVADLPDSASIVVRDNPDKFEQLKLSMDASSADALLLDDLLHTFWLHLDLVAKSHFLMRLMIASMEENVLTRLTAQTVISETTGDFCEIDDVDMWGDAFWSFWPHLKPEFLDHVISWIELMEEISESRVNPVRGVESKYASVAVCTLKKIQRKQIGPKIIAL